MLELKNITKVYEIGKPNDKEYQVTNALKGVSLKFRKNEFVSILGPSGCGKTTMLNIIGGLDKYTEGDLVINNKSTKQYTDKDWDNYRNNSIGFVFQSYNLIPHQTVLENVELALTLSGVKKSERKQRAITALTKVGLKDKIYSKPNQLSGGQMQRVAIARALVNNPEIILADEPTGALDTATSVQVMELLKEVAQERLVIMVTHNPELANEYSTRIIKMLDGNLVDDSNPITIEELEDEKKELEEKKKLAKTEQQKLAKMEKKERKAYLKEKNKNTKKYKKRMSYLTALSLSFKNLLTKKARTLLVAFAGSIGIIGIALVLSLSSGFQGYIDTVQKDTLSKYPVTINSTSTDYTKMLESLSEESDKTIDKDKVYSNNMLSDMLRMLMSGTTKNDLANFKHYLDSEDVQKRLDGKATIKYTYDLDMHIFYNNSEYVNNDQSLLVSPFSMMSSMTSNSTAMSLMSSSFEEMIDNQELLSSQYQIVTGNWAKNEIYKDDNGRNIAEVMIVLDSNNAIADYTLMALGLRDRNEIATLMNPNGESVEGADFEMSVETLKTLEYSLVLNPNMYKHNEETDLYDSVLTNLNTNPQLSSYYTIDVADKSYVEANTEVVLKVAGVIKPEENVTATALTGTVCYTKALTEYVINALEGYQADETTALGKQQLQTYTNKSVITGKYFSLSTAEEIYAYYAENTEEKANLTTEEQAKLLAYYEMVNDPSADPTQILYLSKDIQDTFTERLKSQLDGSTLQATLNKLGKADLDDPASISFYAVDFEAKDDIEAVIKEYNDLVLTEGYNGKQGEDYVINYTDYVGLMMSSISVIINAITYVLIAFVSISLVVSSIMIGIITYISVLERTKEIGVLRSVGASKKDIKRVFTAESLIIGFVAGMLGIIVTLILIIPINIIIESLAGLANIAALPIVGAIVLVTISMVLTFIAGLIPANIASKKDPVIALRTE